VTRTTQRKLADRLFSQLVRSRQRCEAQAFDGINCAGFFQTAHIVRRRYLSVRWDPGNATCLCAAHHVYFTHHPIAEERFHRSYLGPRGLAALKRRAEKANGAPDYDAILEFLRSQPLETVYR
jgi:hypothetical protein